MIGLEYIRRNLPFYQYFNAHIIVIGGPLLKMLWATKSQYCSKPFYSKCARISRLLEVLHLQSLADSNSKGGDWGLGTGDWSKGWPLQVATNPGLLSERRRRVRTAWSGGAKIPAIFQIRPPLPESPPNLCCALLLLNRSSHGSHSNLMADLVLWLTANSEFWPKLASHKFRTLPLECSQFFLGRRSILKRFKLQLQLYCSSMKLLILCSSIWKVWRLQKLHIQDILCFEDCKSTLGQAQL